MSARVEALDVLLVAGSASRHKRMHLAVWRFVRLPACTDTGHPPLV